MQVPAALSGRFESSDLISRVSREGNMEREPHSPDKLVANRGLYQRYVAVMTVLGQKFAISDEDGVGSPQLVAVVVSHKSRQFFSSKGNKGDASQLKQIASQIH
jgi:hypothetical protein